MLSWLYSWRKTNKTFRLSHLYLKLRSQFTLYFFLLVLLPSIIFTVALYFHTRRLMEDKAGENAMTSLSREKAAVVKYFGELEVALNAAADSMPAALKSRLSAMASLDKQSAGLTALINETFTPSQKKALSAVYFITDSGIKASCGPDADYSVISDPSSQQWFYDAVNDTGTVMRLGTVQRFYQEGASKAVLCFAIALNNSGNTGIPAVLLFDFSYSILTDFLYSYPDNTGAPVLNNKSHRMIIDHEGNILYSEDPGKLTAMADEPLYDAVKTMDEGFMRFSANGAGYYLTYTKYPAFNWIFIDLAPAENVTGGLWTRSPLLIVCIIMLPFVLFVFLGVLLRLLRPINNLTAVISDYESKNPGGSAQIPLIQGNTPASASSGESDIDLLIKKIYSIRLSQKEAELNALQNQINPHFLYNTLESIRGAALYHGINDIAAMSKALSLLFRYSISERVLVSIKEELQHLENYIAIQNFRYENKFSMLLSIPSELLNYKILKLTLQPLIENSIKHGLEKKLGRGIIKIEILELDNNIKIQISDDGLGIPPKKLDELNRALANDKHPPINDGDHTGTGIGVMNVNSRIKLYFGDQYGLKFRNAHVGTTVEITLPAVREN